MTRSGRALLIGALCMAAGAVADLLIRGRGLLPLILGVLALALIAVPRLAITAGSALKSIVKSRLWAREQGQHHEFGGVTLRIEHDVRFSWIAGADLKNLLGIREPDDVLAARLSAFWRHDDREQLWLRVDGVIEYLARRPDRMDPRIVRLRRYFEREVIFPAARRRERR
jgi:hypothetical protein